MLHIKGGGKIHTDRFALLTPLQAQRNDKILTMDVVSMRTPHRHRTSTGSLAARVGASLGPLHCAHDDRSAAKTNGLGTPNQSQRACMATARTPGRRRYVTATQHAATTPGLAS